MPGRAAGEFAALQQTHRTAGRLAGQVIGEAGADDASADDDDVEMVCHDSMAAGVANGDERMREILRRAPRARQL